MPFTALYGTRYLGISRSFSDFLSNAAAGTLPPFRMVDPEHPITFIKAVFHANGELRSGLQTELRIDDSVVTVSGDDGLRDPMPAFLYVHVEDTDSTYRCAIAANATSLDMPADMPYDDRRAMVRNPWGNTWQIATHQRTLPDTRIRSRAGNGG